MPCFQVPFSTAIQIFVSLNLNEIFQFSHQFTKSQVAEKKAESFIDFFLKVLVSATVAGNVSYTILSLRCQGETLAESGFISSLARGQNNLYCPVSL